MEKKNFTQIPNNWIADINLTDAEFRTLIALRSYDYGFEEIFPAQSTIALMRSKSVRTIQGHIQKLKENGYLLCKRRGFSKTNDYIINFEKDEENNDTNQ